MADEKRLVGFTAVEGLWLARMILYAAKNGRQIEVQDLVVIGWAMVESDEGNDFAWRRLEPMVLDHISLAPLSLDEWRDEYRPLPEFLQVWHLEGVWREGS